MIQGNPSRLLFQANTSLACDSLQFALHILWLRRDHPTFLQIRCFSHALENVFKILLLPLLWKELRCSRRTQEHSSYFCSAEISSYIAPKKTGQDWHRKAMHHFQDSSSHGGYVPASNSLKTCTNWYSHYSMISKLEKFSVWHWLENVPGQMNLSWSKQANQILIKHEKETAEYRNTLSH